MKWFNKLDDLAQLVFIGYVVTAIIYYGVIVVAALSACYVLFKVVTT